MNLVETVSKLINQGQLTVALDLIEVNTKPEYKDRDLLRTQRERIVALRTLEDGPDREMVTRVTQMAWVTLLDLAETH